MKRVHLDNLPEYIALEDFLFINRIEHTTSTSYTLESNGVSENMNRTLLDITSSIIKQAQVSSPYWAKALNYSVNR